MLTTWLSFCTLVVLTNLKWNIKSHTLLLFCTAQPELWATQQQLLRGPHTLNCGPHGSSSWRGSAQPELWATRQQLLRGLHTLNCGPHSCSSWQGVCRKLVPLSKSVCYELWGWPCKLLSTVASAMRNPTLNDAFQTSSGLALSDKTHQFHPNPHSVRGLDNSTSTRGFLLGMKVLRLQATLWQFHNRMH